MDNESKNNCTICGKIHEKRNIDMLPTWLQCENCGSLYCVQCSKSSVLRISIEKLLMIIIVILFLYFGAFVFQDLQISLTTRLTWGLSMTLLPVAFQLLLLRYHERNTFKEKNVLKTCKNCSSPLTTLYYDGILNNWLMSIYAFNVLVFLFEFFFKLYNIANIPGILTFSTTFTAILFIVIMIMVLVGSIVIAVLLYKYILPSFQSSYRIWIVVILFYIIGLVIPLIITQSYYYISYFGAISSDILKTFNIIFTSIFAAIPKLFWFVPSFLISAIIYTITKKYLMDHKLSSWLKLGIGFVIIIVPLMIWGLSYPLFYEIWDTLLIWCISNFIFSLLLTLGIFSIIEKIRKKENKLGIKTILSVIGLSIGLILFLLIPIFTPYMGQQNTTLFIFIISIFMIFMALFELFNSWFSEKGIWRSKIFKKLPDATYLVIVGIFCYCVAMNMLYLLSLSPSHIIYYLDVPTGTPTSTNYFEILYPNIPLISMIGLFGVISAYMLKFAIKLYYK